MIWRTRLAPCQCEHSFYIRLANVCILFALVHAHATEVHAHAKDFVANDTADTQDDVLIGKTADKFADTYVALIQDSMAESLDNSVGKLCERAVKVPFPQEFGMDQTTLAKPAHLAIHRGPDRLASASMSIAGMRKRPHRLLLGKPAFGGTCLVTCERWNGVAKHVPDAACFPCRRAPLPLNARLDANLDSRLEFLPSQNRYRSLCVTLTLGCSIISYIAYQSNLGPVVALSLWMQFIGFALHWFQLYKTWVGTVDVASSVLGAFIYGAILCQVSVFAVVGHLLVMPLVLWNYFVNLQEHPYTQRQTYMHWLQHLMGTYTNLNFIYWMRPPDWLPDWLVHVPVLLPCTAR